MEAFPVGIPHHKLGYCRNSEPKLVVDLSLGIAFLRTIQGKQGTMALVKRQRSLDEAPEKEYLHCSYQLLSRYAILNDSQRYDKEL